MFSVINFLLAFVTVTVLLAGAAQGAKAYSDYCDDDYPYFKKCDFDHGSRRYDADVDFVVVVVLSGVGALLWVCNNV